MTRFLKFSTSVILVELVKLGTSNFMCCLIHMRTSACIIYYPQKGCVQSHVARLNLGKYVIISCDLCKI